MARVNGPSSPEAGGGGILFGALHARAIGDHRASAFLLEVAREFTPRVEGAGSDLVLLDLQGLGRVWSSPEALGRALAEGGRRRGAEVDVALASTRVAALVAARGCPGLTVIAAGQEASTLAPLPLDVLDLAPERRQLFARWGLRCLGDLAALPAVALSQRLGQEGPRLRRLARGEDEIPLSPTRAPERFEALLELEWPVDGLEPLAFLLGRVLEPLCQHLRRKDRRAAALTFELGLVDGIRHRRTVKPAAPSAEPRTWRTLILLDLETLPPRDAIQAIRLLAEPTPARAVQFSLLDPAQPSPERLAETLARLQDWTAAGRAGAPVLLDTHRPGVFLLGSFDPGRVTAGGGEVTVPRLVLRSYRPPRPAQVAFQDGGPTFVSASGLRGPVVDRAGPWRVSGDWWDVAWSREEWDVALGSEGDPGRARLYRLFRDRLRGGWFVEGELD